MQDKGTNNTASSDHATDAECGFAGTLKNIQLNDLIQMCCLSASSLCMRVTKDNRVGTIFIVDGEIVHAACADQVGEEAFYRILGWQTGCFESIEVKSTPQRTIDRNHNYMIMEAARRADEKVQSEIDASPPAPVPAAGRDASVLNVLIVDDSPMMRKILASMLTTSKRINVIGMAGNGKEAIAMINDLSPDLVTLDVNMPVMDGTSTIKHIMIEKPCPVVITSNPGDGSSKAIFNFLELGAVDFMSKPTKNQDVLIQQQKILERIRIAATAKVRNFRIARVHKAATADSPGPDTDATCRRVVVVISGPGGHPEQMSLLSQLVPAMGEIGGSVVAIQSLPPFFSQSFAQYLVERCGCPASAVEERTVLRPGHCYVGIHGCPLRFDATDSGSVIEPCDADNGLIHVDRLLQSTASVFDHRSAVVLLSGADTGSQAGIRAVHDCGGRIIVRDRQSSLVAQPLDAVVDGGLADTEVMPADLMNAVLNGFEKDAR